MYFNKHFTAGLQNPKIISENRPKLEYSWPNYSFFLKKVILRTINVDEGSMLWKYVVRCLCPSCWFFYY